MDATSGGTKGMRPRELAEQAGVSTRTLRYYESIGLLCPHRSWNGYRAYADADAKRLAQIQAMKLCGLPLGTIRELLDGKSASLYDALAHHLLTLRAQGESLKLAAAHTEAAMRAIERIDHMEARDAFEELKAQGLREFEATYGAEARERYGDDAIDASNARMMALSQDEWDAKELLEESIKVQLRLAMATGDASSAEARELARMHERWVSIHWGGISDREAYLGLVQGYGADPRFVSYYDSAAGAGATAFLADAVRAYQASERTE